MQVQAVRTASPTNVFTQDSSGMFSVLVHAVTSTLTPSGDTQVYLHWMPTPAVRPVFGICTMALSESTFGVTFSTTLVGSTPRTYLSIHSHAGQGGPSPGSLIAVPALVYE